MLTRATFTTTAAYYRESYFISIGKPDMKTHHFLPDGRVRTSAVAVAAAAADAKVTPTREYSNQLPDARPLLLLLLLPLRAAKNELAGLHLCATSVVGAGKPIAVPPLRRRRGGVPNQLSGQILRRSTKDPRPHRCAKCYCYLHIANIYHPRALR